MCTFWNAGVAASFFSSSPSLPPCRGWWNETRCLTNPDCRRVWFCTWLTNHNTVCQVPPPFFFYLWQQRTKPGLFLSTKIFFFSAYLMVFPQALQTRCSVLYQNRRQFNSFIASPFPNTHSLPYLADLHIVSSWEVNVTSWVSVRKNTNEYDQSSELPWNCFSVLAIGLQGEQVVKGHLDWLETLHHQTLMNFPLASIYFGFHFITYC